MKAGDRIIYTIDGRHGVADEFLHDGDAFVAFDDGKHETVKWHHLTPERCPYSDGNSCELYRLQGQRCQNCPENEV